MHDYTCAGCGGTFTDPRPDGKAEAAAETLAVFGVAHQPDDIVLCDDCFDELLDAEDDLRAEIARRLLEREGGDHAE